NATVAASALGGLLTGVALAGLLVALLLALQWLGAWPQFALAHSMSSVWTGIEVAAGEIALAVPVGLALALCVLPALARWSNRPQPGVARRGLGGAGDPGRAAAAERAPSRQPARDRLPLRGRPAARPADRRARASARRARDGAPHPELDPAGPAAAVGGSRSR